MLEPNVVVVTTDRGGYAVVLADHTVTARSLFRPRSSGPLRAMPAGTLRQAQSHTHVTLHPRFESSSIEVIDQRHITLHDRLMT
jgi:hypothetical protein